jgi:3-oxoacyl-[acyl-carrier protein] reductase
MTAGGRRSVFITGAGIGIGAACARSFAAAGYRVVVTDVLEQEGEQTAARIRSDGGQADFVALDVRDTAQVDDAVLRTQGDGFDVVIANAGIARRQPFTELSDDGWTQTLDVNLNGGMRVFRAALGAMVERRQGALIALSSISGVAYGWDQHAHYSASKAGVIGLVRALAVEFGAAGIRANGIAPGFIRTAQSLSVEHSRRRRPFPCSGSASRRKSRTSPCSSPRMRLATCPARYWSSTAAYSSGRGSPDAADPRLRLATQCRPRRRADRDGQLRRAGILRRTGADRGTCHGFR